MAQTAEVVLYMGQSVFCFVYNMDCAKSVARWHSRY